MEDRWVVEREFHILEETGIKDRAQYVLSTTINLALTIHSEKRKIKYAEYRLYRVKLKHTKVPVYEKADRKSKILQYCPDDMQFLRVSHSVEGLSDDGIYWFAIHHDEEHSIWGYIYDQDIEIEV